MRLRPVVSSSSLLLVVAAVLSIVVSTTAFLHRPAGQALALRNIRWTAAAAAAAAAASSSPFGQRRGLLLVAAAAQQEEQGNGSSRDNAVRSLFTDARERRRQQEEAAAAAHEAADSNKAAGGIDDDEAAVRRIVASRTGMAATRGDVNVLGGALELCGTDPMTGFTREGCCTTGPQDFGSHTVCAVVTEEFLNYSRAQGNDLITPRPEYRFPGLKSGDRWCLCASRWQEAMAAGVAPQVVLKATHRKALEVCSLEDLTAHAVDAGEAAGAAASGAKEEL